MRKIQYISLVTFLFAGSAYAQGQVTLYGLLDEGILVNSNAGGHSSVAMASGILQGNRWGLLGKEDLGGGLSAVFTLENGFDLSTGKLGWGGREFGRQAYVGLSNAIGTLTVGRHYDPIGDFVGGYGVGATTSGATAAHPGDLDQMLSQYRIDNSVKFISKPIGGFSYSALYSFGGVAGDFSRNQVWSLGAGYTNGPFSAGLAYLNARNPNMSMAGASASTATALTNSATYFASPVVSGFASAHTYQAIASGASYTFGRATVSATYSNVKFLGLNDLSSGPNPAGYRGTATLQSAEINLKVYVTPAFVVAPAYNYTKGSSVSTLTASNPGASYQQASLSGDYYLSKRTDVYAVASYQKASGTDSRDLPAVASLATLTPSSNNHQAALRLGIRHKF